MKRLLAVLAICLGFGVSGSAQGNKWQGIHLVGRMTPPLEQDVSISVWTEGKSQICSEWPEIAGVLCSEDIERGATSARIEIRARGYKVFALNVPRLSFTGDLAVVNIGTVALVKTELPSVQRIILGQAEGGKRVFQLTLKNSLPRDVFIRVLRIDAQRPGNGMACCCPPTEVYELGSTLSVSGGGTGEMSVDGKYRELVKGQDFSVAVTGSIERFTCDDSLTLSLTLPVSFVIPKSSFSAIQVRVPETFDVRNTSYCCTDDEDIPKTKPRVNASITKLGKFKDFRFTLSTEEKDELDITTSYPMDKMSAVSALSDS